MQKLTKINNIKIKHILKKDAKKAILVIIPIVIMGLLTIPNLGNREMWIDEAFCVVMGERTFTYGYPKSWDGFNFATVLNGADFIGDFFHILLNLFPYYIVSFSLLFSNTIFGIRIWFVIFGLLSALFLYFAFYEFTSNHHIAYLSLWIYCLCIPVLIYIKVAQYYAPSLLFINSSCYFYIKFQKLKLNRYRLLYVFAMSLLFYTNYLFFGILFISMMCTIVIKERNIKSVWMDYLKQYILIFLFILPYLLAKAYYLLNFGSTYPIQNLQGFLTQFPGYLWQIQAYFFPFVSLILLYLIKKYITFFVKKCKDANNDNIINEFKKKAQSAQTNYVYFLSVTIVLLNVVIISALTWDYATRYLIVSIPFCCLLSAALIYKIFEKDDIAMSLFIAIFLFTNIIHELPYFCMKYVDYNYEKSWLIKPPVLYYDLDFIDNKQTLQEYLEGIKIKSIFNTYITTYMKDYDNADEAAVLFSQKYVKNDETMLNLSTSTFNIMYYCDCKIVQYIENPDSIIMNYGYIEKNRPITWAKNLHYFSLSYTPIEYVDWIVVNTNDLISESDYLSPEFRQILLDDSKFERYDIEGYPFLPFVADIWNYSFETDYSYQGITFFRNKLTTAAIDVVLPITREQLLPGG